MRDQKAIEYDGVVSPLRDEPSAFKRQCFRDGWDSAIAALPDMVQPLVWDIHYSREQIGATGLFGEVYVTRFGGEWFHKGECFAEDVDAAKAAAQADYTRRILSAFGITEGET